LHRRIFLVALAASCGTQLAACVGLSTDELQIIGARVVHTEINFNDLYAYAQRSNVAYQDKHSIQEKYPLTIRVNSPGHAEVRYFMERDERTHTQFITVRGTNNDKNLSEDLNIAVRRDRHVDIPVHTGFDLAARAVYEDLRPLLKPGYKTYVTGHSLGGAVAAILAIYLIEDGVEVERVVTFGQPRFTTAAGVKRLDFLPLTRVVDENDIVPLVPPNFFVTSEFGPYEHVGTEVILLAGPEFVFLPAHDANRIALGEFWRSLSYSDLKDHEMKKYLNRIAIKAGHAQEVPYNEREKYVVLSADQVRN
jgi:triacylglycerol lipase